MLRPVLFGTGRFFVQIFLSALAPSALHAYHKYSTVRCHNNQTTI